MPTQDVADLYTLRPWAVEMMYGVVPIPLVESFTEKQQNKHQGKNTHHKIHYPREGVREEGKVTFDC